MTSLYKHITHAVLIKKNSVVVAFVASYMEIW